MPPTAATYVERRADSQLQQLLLAGHFCYVFNARQMGKSSLRVHTMATLAQLGVQSVAIDLTAIGSQQITVDQWYAAIAAYLTRGLKLPIDLGMWWRSQAHLPAVARLGHLIDEIILPALASPLVIFIDEIDSILGLAFPTDDFFALIRTCFNRRADSSAYRRLTFALFGVATPSALMRDKARTPFNIGQAVELAGFTLAEAQPLVEPLRPWIDDPAAVLARVLHWSGGQPFLTQKLCHLVVKAAASQGKPATAWVDQLVQQQIICNWERHDEPEHLKTIRDRLARQPQRLGQLLGLYQQVLEQGAVALDNSPDQTELLLLGLVDRCDGHIQVKNPIYRAVFDPAWVQQQLNDLRPYAAPLNAWVASDCTDESRLLRGQALQETLTWAEHRRLSPLDYQFLAASQELDRQEALARAEVERLAEVEARLAIEHQRTHEQQRHLRRQRLLLGAVTTALVATTALGFIARRQYHQAAQSEAQAIVRSAESLLASDQSFEALIEAIRGQQRLRQLPRVNPALQTQADAILERIVLGLHQKNRLRGHSAAVLATSFNPGPAHAGQIATAGVDTTVKLWRPDGPLIATLTGHQATIRALKYSPDGRYLASAGDDGTIRLWSPAGTLERTIKTPMASIWSLAFSADGRSLLAAGNGNQALLYSLEGEVLRRFEHPGEVTGLRSVAYSPKGDAIALGGNNSVISLWRADGQYLKSLTDHSDPIHSLAYSPAGDRLISGSTDKTIKLWTIDGDLISTLTHHQAPVKEIAFSPDGREFVSASWDKTLALWSASGTLLTTLKGHSAAVWGVAYSPDGTTIASAGADSEVLLWQAQNPFYKKLQGLSAVALGAVFSPDGQTLATAGSDQYVTFIAPGPATMTKLEAHQAGVSNLALHPTQPWLTTTSEDGSVRVWDFSRTLKQSFGSHDAAVLGAAWHPSGDELLASTVTGQLYRWQADGTLLERWAGALAPIWDIAYSPDGSQFATASNDGNLRLWNREGELLHSLEHGSAVWRVAYSPDGQWLVTGSGDNTARLWQPDGTLAATLTGHQAAVWGLDFNPASSLLATASIDETVKLWRLDCLTTPACQAEAAPGQSTTLITTLNQHNSGIRSLRFNAQGTVLASVGDDETVVLWNVEPILALDPLAYGCAWIADYLRTNAQVSQRDRQLCDEL
nr:AAA-like domain-containing protein [Nodosilinea sp. TSF1-S3]